jgi:hypothetical protein
MKRTGLLVILAWVVLAVEARAYIGPPSLWSRLAAYDAAIVGRIASFEAAPVTLTSVNGGGPCTHRVSVIEVLRPLYGAERVTHVRVAFTDTPDNFAQNVGKEAVLLLRAHPEAPVYVQPWGWQDIIGRHQDEQIYAEQFLPWMERLARVRRELDCCLKGPRPEERFLAAAILLVQHRGIWGARGTKTEPLDADRSRAVLQALLDADWSKEGFDWDRISPMMIFLSLGLTKEDGWDPGGVITTEKAKTWLRQHLETYRIRSRATAKK